MSTATTAESDVVEVLLKALERADEPLTASQLLKDLPKSYRPSANRLGPLLEDQVAAGRLHRFEPYRIKSPRYWTRDLDHYARDVILRLLTERPRPRAELLRNLRSPLKGCSNERLRQVIRGLEDEGQIRELPTFVRSRAAKRLSTRPPDPRDYLEDALKEIYRKLEEEGISRAEVVAAARAMFGPTPLAPLEDEAIPAPATSAPEPREADLGQAILDMMMEVEPAAANGALVSLRDLRRRMDFQVTDKAAFDAAVLRLADEGRVSLNRHGFPGSLTEDERAEMVPDGRGSYYNGIMRRV